MYVVDASVWVSRFVAGDVYYQFSCSWLGAQLEHGELLVAPAIAPAEVAGAISRRTGRPEFGKRAVSLLLHLPNTRLIPVEAALAEEGAAAAADLKLRGGDALYIALAHRLGVPLVTWDQEQQQRGSQIVVVVSPRDATKR